VKNVDVKTNSIAVRNFVINSCFYWYKSIFFWSVNSQIQKYIE